MGKEPKRVITSTVGWSNWELWSRKELCQIVWQLTVSMVTICCAISDTSKKLCSPHWFHAKMVGKKQKSWTWTQYLLTSSFLWVLRIFLLALLVPIWLHILDPHCQVLHEWQSKTQQRSADRINQQLQNTPKTYPKKIPSLEEIYL